MFAGLMRTEWETLDSGGMEKRKKKMIEEGEDEAGMQTRSQ